MRDQRARVKSGAELVKIDYVLLGVLAELASWHGKDYCFPNGETIVKRYQWTTGRTMSLRNLWRHMATLARDGYIRRIRRHQRGASGELELHSTLYVLLDRTWSWLRRTAKATARALTHLWPRARKTAVTAPAQYLRPTQDNPLRAARSSPPPEWEELRQRLRRQ